MAGLARSSGPRSNMYSSQRFTNWTPHDPHWSEVEALPTRPRPTTSLRRESGEVWSLFERRLAADFVRPCTTDEIVNVVGTVPQQFLDRLTGIYLMGGTAKQARARALTFGLYSRDRIFLFPIPAKKLATGWTCSGSPAVTQSYRQFGADIQPGRRGMTVTFDEDSLRRFYLYDVLLHEIGHHADQQKRTHRDAERFARWFADYQHSQLPR